MELNAVRARYLAFMKKNNHNILKSASLLPKEDATTLFIGSGMQPLILYLLGKEHPAGKLIANSQKCFRANDINEVGDNRHTTFFEMLGNWSLGGYFKETQIKQVFEFLTNAEYGLGLDPNKLYITIFAGDKKYNIPRDDESANIWKKIFEENSLSNGIAFIGSVENGYRVGMNKEERIFFYNSDKNWWSRAGTPENMPIGEIGGPDTEIFYDFGESACNDTHKGLLPHPNSDSGRFIEICNSVFMEYIKTKKGFEVLPKKNVDFGAGLERLTMATNNNPDVFLTDVFKKVIDLIGKTYNKNPKPYRIIADHTRAAVMLSGDGVVPSNTGEGYVLRRLIRKSIYSLRCDIKNTDVLFEEIIDLFIDKYKTIYNDMNFDNIKLVLQTEVIKFEKTLNKGVKVFNKLVKNKKKLTGKEIFLLQSTYGFPFELTKDMATHSKIEFDEDDYRLEIQKHKEKSRMSSDMRFKSGLSSIGDMETKYHTATHLLHQALKDVLGENAAQKGSNITPERLRFDFSYTSKLTNQQIKKLEDVVNKKISEGLDVSFEEMDKKSALKSKAIGLFEDKYSDILKIYSIGGFSKEFCDGPHVKNTSILGEFKIIKEESIAQGIRRIKAVLK